MLIFNAAQQSAILQSRRVFNEHAVAMAARYAGQEAFAGNSLAIPLDAWRRIDSRAKALARTRLPIFNRLAAANTTPVDIADIVNFYPQVGDSGDVLVSMDGRNAAKADQAAMKFAGTPVPIFTSTVRLGWRQMRVLQKANSTLDTTSIANSQRRIAEKMEDMVLNGLSSIVVEGNTIYGLRNLPSRNTFVHGLTLATATGSQWVGMVKAMVAQATGDNQYGRITLIVNQGDYTAADLTDYAAGYSGTILERLKAVSQLVEIIPAASLPVNEVIGIVDLDAGEWGSILSAMPMTTRPKTRLEPEDDYLFGVIAACAPQFRSDYNGQSAFIHGTTA